ncbi:MAG: hypothetical protein SNJ74_04760 [Fimbriimonadaceae bacterium]
MLRRVLALVALAVAAVPVVSAQESFARRAVDIRAGVVLLDSQQLNGFPRNFAPYVWYTLDSFAQAKPAGWNIFNPVANTRVTPEIQARWAAQNGALGSPFAPPAVGSALTKRDASYWEVRLSQASDAQIAQFDVLAVSAHGFVSLNPLERERLRTFMEGGGVLWVDVTTGTTVDVTNNFPLPIATVNGSSTIGGDLTHPLLRLPNRLTPADAANLFGPNTTGLRSVDLAALGLGDIQPIQGTLLPEGDRLLTVLSSLRGPGVAVGRVGDGFQVVTSIDAHLGLSRGSLIGSDVVQVNQFATSLRPTFDARANAVARFAVNLIQLTSGFGQSAQGARRTNSTRADVDAPLLRRFSAEIPLNPGPGNYVPPAVYKGLVFLATDNQILAFDANPSSDLTGDGKPDDGVPDFAFGANQDLVWSSQVLTGPISSPTVVEVANGAPADQVAVVDGQGNLVVFDATPATLGTNVAPVAVINPPTASSLDTSLPGRGPYAPTFHDGFYFVADEVATGIGGATGRVWVASALTLARVSTANPFAAGGAANPALGRPSGSPTVGYIPIADNSGGVDRVVYFPSRPSAVAGPNATAGITSLWLGAKGEKPIGFSGAGPVLTVQTRASQAGLQVVAGGAASLLGIKLTVLDSSGNPLSAAQMQALFTGGVSEASGILNFNLRDASLWSSDYDVRIDYTIDWGTGTPAQNAQLVRGQVFFPDNSNRSRRILGGVALSPQGTLHAVVGNGTLGGALWSLVEEGRGNFRVVNRWELYPSYRFVLNQTQVQTVDPTLGDTDPVQAFADPFIGGPFSNLSMQGSPTVHNGVVYVTARGNKRGFVNSTILLAFDAEPGAAVIPVGDLSADARIVQSDVARSDGMGSANWQPGVLTQLQSGQFAYEREPTDSRGQIRIDNLAQGSRGPLTNVLSRSQPIVIRSGGTADRVVEPDRLGGRWNPLLWYVVLHGVRNGSPALVTGETLYVAGQSVLPSILSGAGLTPRGILWAMDAQISPNDEFLRSDPNRPWLKQVWQFSTNGGFRANGAVRWPQVAGVQSFDDWRVRLLQTVLGASNDAFGVIGGEGTLFSWGPNGLYAFSRQDFMVVDQGRVGRFDPSGNPLWVTDATSTTAIEGDAGSASVVRPLVSPSRAYALGPREQIIVDTGANRIARIDHNGREIRSIEGFRLDPNFTPDGFSSGDPLRLNQPRDVIVFTSFRANPTQFSNARPLEFWVHYVIADSGNRRLVEIVDRYEADPVTRTVGNVVTQSDGRRAIGVLLWHSPAEFSGRQFDYSSLDRVYVPTGGGRYVYAAGIGSIRPTRVDLGLDSPTATSIRTSDRGRGGIVIIDGGDTIVLNEVQIPDIAANVFFNFESGAFDSAAQPARRKPIGTVTSVTMRNVVDPIFGPRIAIMFTDDDGVFEIIQPNIGGDWVVRWMMPRQAYQAMRRNLGNGLPAPSNARDLRAMFARRLDSGEVLIVNGYVGLTRGNPAASIPPVAFNGEVIQVDGDVDPTNNNSLPGFGFGKTNLGFNSISVRFELPPIQGTRGLSLPVFADRR